MASITGVGGIFLRANNPDALYAWYERHLGLVRREGAFAFPVSQQSSPTVFAFVSQDDGYFPTMQKAMLNLQVDDLNAVLARLQAEGVTIDPNPESYAFGKFGWCTDPEGNRIELWQPAPNEDINT